MAETTNVAPTTEEEIERRRAEGDSMYGWTAQQPAPPPNEREMPQQYLPEMIPEDRHAPVPEDQITDDASLVDPPGTIVVNRQILAAHGGGTAGVGDSGSSGGGDGDLNSMTKAELVDMAREQGVEGYSQMNKDELVAALGG